MIIGMRTMNRALNAVRRSNPLGRQVTVMFRYPAASVITVIKSWPRECR